MSRLTKRQRELKARYTRVMKYAEGYRAELIIGVQGFGIGYFGGDKRMSDWTARMLAIALDNLIREETHAAK
jgi:hypothetical protein